MAISANKEKFFETMSNQYLALTYDDVLVNPARSEITPSEVDTRSFFSKNVELKIPMVSAAMDTVTESTMAIAMAKLGGLGVIHAGLSIEDQKHEVRRVKLELNGLINNPIVIKVDRSINSVLNECNQRGFDFRTFPVVDNNDRLVGVLTGNDIEFCDSSEDSVENAMTPIKEIISAPVGTGIEKAYQLMKDHKKKTLPIIDKENYVQGLYLWSDVSRIVKGNASKYNVDQEGRLRVAAAVPTDEEAIDRVKNMVQYLDVVVIDTAQGDSRFAFETLESLKSEFSNLDVVVGNISAGNSARDLAEAGADGVKVGQGPGSICTTRIQTGMGKPQVSAIYECAKATEKYNIPICADGGITKNGDILVALVAGAHSVMMGNKLAGTDEAPGRIETSNGKKVMLYRGMGSPSAIRESVAARKRYGGDANSQPLVEGVESFVPYQGSINRVIDELEKALRKGMSYVGAKDINYLREEANLSRITNNGMRESYPHDVQVI